MTKVMGADSENFLYDIKEDDLDLPTYTVGFTERLMHEVKRLQAHDKEMQKLFRSALSQAPSFLCKSCQKKWLDVAESHKRFIKMALGED